MVEVSPLLALAPMELTTILNRCHDFRGFVYVHAQRRGKLRTFRLRPKTPRCSCKSIRIVPANPVIYGGVLSCG